ncbi:MAG: NAD(P)H-dependent oxidoreductase subunit E [Candidatus Rokubacteria bacterium]|nr:NAD(P)H-dependent oxidoreductase subunit E [Candidatus Rokubacteria bacterium]
MTDRAPILGGFPRERSWLLPALQAVQHRERWLSPEALLAVADHLRVPRSEVYGVATQYPEFRLSEPGRRIVRVCVGVSCRVKGSLELLAALERRLSVAADSRTADGAITLERLDCAFNCAMAPVVEVDGRQLGRLAPDKQGRLLALLGSDEPPPATPLVAPAASRLAPVPAPPPGRGGARERFAALESAAAAADSPGLRLVAGVGSCGVSVGAEETLRALEAEAGRRGIEAAVVAGGCGGFCWAAPAVTVIPPNGAPVIAAGITADRVGGLLDAAAAGRLVQEPEVSAWLSGQRRVLTERCGLTDPGDIADAIRRGSYAALAEALAAGNPAEVIATVKSAGLAGRGGAYFRAAIKWEGARAAAGEPRYLIVNGEEGEPGIFKDRHLMEGDPHRLLEGALLAADAAGASRIYLYVHGEAHLSAARLEHAVGQARGWGLAGERILGSDLSVEIEIRRGAGGFVLGEESALMESIEGRRAMPRAKPPFPVEAGLWGRPTVINNVETLSAVPLILRRGAAWWTSLGRGHGTKCVGLSGHVSRPGIVELEMGATLREVLASGGGEPPGGRWLQAVLLGGPSGSLVHPRLLDEPVLPGGAVSPGSGGIVALDDSVSIRDVVLTLLDFNARESCGKCTPCREGTARLRDMLDGGLRASADELRQLCEVVRLASLCGLGQAAPLSILSALAGFPEALP